MATSAPPYGSGQRPNVPSSAVRFPAIKSYDQVDDEIIGTLRPTLGWFFALGTAILCLLIGIVGMFDLRILGIAKGLPLASLKRLLPWGVFGFVLCLVTGGW